MKKWEGPFLRHVIMLHHLRRRLCQVRNHLLCWHWRILYFIIFSFIIRMSFGLYVAMLIQNVNVHWLVHHVHGLTCFGIDFSCVFQLFMFVLVCLMVWKLSYILFKWAMLCYNCCNIMLDGTGWPTLLLPVFILLAFKFHYWHVIWGLNCVLYFDNCACCVDCSNISLVMFWNICWTCSLTLTLPVDALFNAEGWHLHFIWCIHCICTWYFGAWVCKLEDF